MIRKHHRNNLSAMKSETNKKRILVVTSRLPFVYGGNSILAQSISANLTRMGYWSDIWFTPQNRFGRQAAAYFANRLTDLGLTGTDEQIDGIISLRFPSFAVKHPYHVCWINHCMREYYDLWDHHRTKLTSPFAVSKEHIRKWMIHKIDKYLLAHNVTKLFAQSKNIAYRLKDSVGIQCEVLYPPPRSDFSYEHGKYDDYILSVSRLNKRKRHDLFIKSFALLKKCQIKGIIAGDGEEYTYLKQLIEEKGLENQVQLLGAVSVEKLNSLYSNALAVFFAPVDEDYGNVTLEAFRFGKPVISAPDSGGPLEFIHHGENGFIVDPEPQQIADIFIKLFENKSQTRDMGTFAYEMSLEHTWENTIPRLVPSG
ncbi:MAG: hypothetical protein A2161_11325 [Candidatus Schekmanbacteria bacterium RBG_13_48_7]|uniref:Glycosyl transferase family 1 domain-containing protein n=1 Tax=Candidatus Schekmanbacteria bacterium RBG_13_48_7 TaxID=1817878 RepID=A0A1F7S6L9_9BACT|nr:MAG: hypothetical protein A2161_11325 [Candidatus Schekmanbacteria bacterium RBG_13_48_7]